MINQFITINQKAARWLEKRWPRIFCGPSYKDELLKQINAELEKNDRLDILEVGGIDRPLLKKSHRYKYIGLDIEIKPNCSEIYDQFFVQSVEQPLPVKTDMVISITLLEHVPNNRAGIQSISDALLDGGTTHHYIPSKWHPYSIALRLVGHRLQVRLIRLLRPSAIKVTGYPAFFDHCSPFAMQKLLKQCGLSSVTIRPFYRANDYFAFFLPAYLLVTLYENACARLGIQALCSGFIISASKNEPNP